MSVKPIREFHGKQIVAKHLASFWPGGNEFAASRAVLITKEVTDPSNPSITFDTLAQEHPWLLTDKLVVKPDQLIKRRGKSGLLGLNKSYAECQEWIMERMLKECKVQAVTGLLDTFIVEPMVPHEQSDEYYVCIQSHRGHDEILFHHEGGVDVGNVDTKAARLQVPVGDELTPEAAAAALLAEVPPARRGVLAGFLAALLRLARALNFAYLEINPLAVLEGGGEGPPRLAPLDMAAKVDETAAFLNQTQWGELDFPAPFGRPEFPEEAYVKELDAKTGASLKLTVLNHAGRVWTLVAGGGASVVYADTISDLGFGHELANYGEYSGAPTEEATNEYARTILGLMTRVKDERGKVLIIGGGIANFTDIAATFKGIISALKSYAEELREGKVTIWVRRGGPNYQEGLKKMKACGKQIGVPIRVFGPETSIVAIVPMALGLADPGEVEEWSEEASQINKVTRSKSVAAQLLRSSSSGGGGGDDDDGGGKLPPVAGEGQGEEGEGEEGQPPAKRARRRGGGGAEERRHRVVDFTPETRCVVYGLQQRAVQGMLDFDFMCKRTRPSVAAMIFPFSSNHFVKFYWGTEEILVPVYQRTAEAVAKHPDASVAVNFASFRSVQGSTEELLGHADQIKTIAIIAEGVPETQARAIIRRADALGVGVIGPATVGGIKPGCFRIGNTGGMLDNIVFSKLYRPGSVAYVSKSGGMSNELNCIVAAHADGVYEGVAIGGDRYPGSRFRDHLRRYEDNPEVKILVLLGEVGGTDEYEICEDLKSGRLTKPLVAWCIGTCAAIFPFEVQFGHAGALARGRGETAAAKNEALRAAGARVPLSFDKFGEVLGEVYAELVREKKLVPAPEPEAPKVPMDYTWARRLGLVRKPANFVSTISDERGEELKYAGTPISEVFARGMGVGGVLSLLWFCRKLPPYATKFIEMVLMVTADHGPAVSGAHNTIVAARAGKDLVSALASGLLTIGPRFGGALDEAAVLFSEAADAGLTAQDFVKKMRAANKLIMGIGHRVKSVTNPDTRVEVIKSYAREHFQSTAVLDFALAVEQVTTQKRANLILNVDGCIAVCFVDLLRSCGAFTHEEAHELVAHGCLNGLFVLGRSIGFIGHYLDQKRLKQPLYRHPWDDISYIGAST